MTELDFGRVFLVNSPIADVFGDSCANQHPAARISFIYKEKIVTLAQYENEFGGIALKTIILAAAMAIITTISASSALAATVVLDNPRVATQILSLDILGTKYDVGFNNVGDGTFVGNTAGATAARDAIIAALNTTTADLVRIANTGVTVNNFGVQDGASSVRGVSFFIAGNWQTSGNTALLAPIAQFSVAAPVPIPASLPLLIAGIAGVGFVARRKNKKT